MAKDEVLPTIATSSRSGSIADPENVDNDSPQAREWTSRSLLCVIGAALAAFCCSGFLNAFGVFQAYYISHQLSHKTTSDIAWIGSLGNCLLFVGAAPVGVLMKRVSVTTLVCIGTVLEVLAIFMLSICKEYYHFLLAQGVLLGISMSFLMIPTIVIIPLWFTRSKGLATGLCIAGSSTGGIIWPIMLDQLLNKRQMSFSSTIRIVGYMLLALLCITILTVRAPPSKEEQKDEKKVSAKDALKQPAFIALWIALALYYLGLFIPMFFISLYSEHNGHSVSFSFYLVAILNGASLFGRIGAGHIGDLIGYFNITFVVAAFSAVLCFCWPAVSSAAGLVFFALAYGLTSGSILSLQLPCASQLSKPETHHLAVGAIFAAGSITSLIGSPIAGTIQVHGYVALSMFTASVLVLGAVLIAVARLLQDRRIFVKV